MPRRPHRPNSSATADPGSTAMRIAATLFAAPCSRLPCRRRRRRSADFASHRGQGRPGRDCPPAAGGRHLITAADLQRGDVAHRTPVAAPGHDLAAARRCGLARRVLLRPAAGAQPAGAGRRRRRLRLRRRLRPPAAASPPAGPPPPPQPADHHQQSGAAGRHQRQRQRGAAADGNGPGPIAQQQVAGTGPGGALNLVTGGGNIIQRSPGTR